MVAHAENPRPGVTDYRIEPHPHKRGVSESLLVFDDVAIPVWALAGYYQVVSVNLDRLAADYDIPREAAGVAIAFYEQHRAEIDDRIAQNDELIA